MASDLYLGYRNDDADTPFGKFFKPEMAPLPQHVVVALQHGPRPGWRCSPSTTPRASLMRAIS